MLMHVEKADNDAVQNQSVEGRITWKNLRRNKIWYGNGQERINLLIYREKVGVLIKLAMQEEAKGRNLRADKDE